MIKGLYRGYSGLIYIYYRGTYQVVLSDVNAGFLLGASDMATTGLRIVLKPGEWTECAYKYVSNDFESNKGMLYNLEKSGYVDIYTDPLEVEALKKQQNDKKVNAEVESKPVNNSNKKQYFNMKMFTEGENNSAVNTGECHKEHKDYNEDLVKEFKKQNDMMQQQMAAMINMTNTVTKLLNTYISEKEKENK